MKWSDTLNCEILWDMLESTTGQFSIVTVYQWSPDESAIFDFGEVNRANRPRFQLR